MNTIFRHLWYTHEWAMTEAARIARITGRRQRVALQQGPYRLAWVIVEIESAA